MQRMPCPGSGTVTTERECADLCDRTPGCQAIVFDEQPLDPVESLCYIYDTPDLTPGSSSKPPWAHAVPTRLCVADLGCPHPASAASHNLVLVLVIRFVTHVLRDWLHYHSVLGVRHFVLISNECDAQAHTAMLAAAASVPCAPRLSFINAYRCAAGFQTRAYSEAVQLLLEHVSRLKTLSALFEDSAPCVRLAVPGAQAAPSRP